MVETDNYSHYCGEMYVGHHGTFSVDGDVAARIEKELSIKSSSKIVNFTFYVKGEKSSINYVVSAKSNEAERLMRLSAAPKMPRKRIIVTEVFDRNSDVIVQALYLAKGHCQQCLNRAPFVRSSDGTPYLEVHHIVPLAMGGEDTIANAIALCPNCHRKAHYG